MSSPLHETLLRPTQDYQISPPRVQVVARMNSKHSTGKSDKHNLQQHSLAVLNPLTPLVIHPNIPSISRPSKSIKIRDYNNYSRFISSEDILCKTMCKLILRPSSNRAKNGITNTKSFSTKSPASIY